ncbi:hypothetical protein [Streptomyces olivaceus]|uniref:hypothetical protein n=1 Tax=Streptomyces olivaceus TaxID=47716 RepID=UPI00362A14FC
MSDPATAPPGHSISAHRAHGWCTVCPGRTAGEEVMAWRALATAQHATEGAVAAHADRFDAEVSEWTRCPKCGQDEALGVITVTARTDNGPRKAGGWSFCLSCQATPHLLLEVSHG